MTQQQLDALNDYIARYPGLIHASNILAKYNKPGKTNNQVAAIDAVVVKYLKYIDDNLQIQGYDNAAIDGRVRLLNQYYADFKPYEAVFSSQSKWRSTILEEFMYLLFRDFVDSKKQGTNLTLGSTKAYSNAYFKASDFAGFITSIQLGINEKDQDFAIYRPLKLEIAGESSAEINVPVMSVEVKTYVDKTMFEGIVATSEKIKNGNPFAKFYVVTETYDVSFDVDPAYTRIDQIYVLRKSKRKKNPLPPVDADVVKRLVSDVVLHFTTKWSDVKERLDNDGCLI